MWYVKLIIIIRRIYKIRNKSWCHSLKKSRTKILKPVLFDSVQKIINDINKANYQNNHFLRMQNDLYFFAENWNWNCITSPIYLFLTLIQLSNEKFKNFYSFESTLVLSNSSLLLSCLPISGMQSTYNCYKNPSREFDDVYFL